MGNHWALCTTWFPLCFPSISQQQNCFYSRHPGFHQRVRLAGKKYNGSSPNWPHLLIHNRPGMNTLLQSLSRMQKGCMGEIQQLWEVPSDLHKISKVPDWHMMKCLVFSILSHTFTENISEKAFKGRMSRWWTWGNLHNWSFWQGLRKTFLSFHGLIHV